MQRLLALNPDTTIATVRALNRLQMQRNPLGFAAFLDGLRVSGLPEE